MRWKRRHGDERMFRSGYRKVGWRFGGSPTIKILCMLRIGESGGETNFGEPDKMLNQDAVWWKTAPFRGGGGWMLPFGETFTFASEDDGKNTGEAFQEITRKQGQLATVEPYGSIEVVDIPRT